MKVKWVIALGLALNCQAASLTQLASHDEDSENVQVENIYGIPSDEEKLQMAKLKAVK